MIPAPVPDLNRTLMDNLALVLGVMGVVIIGLAIVAFAQSRRLKQATGAYRSLVSDSQNRCNSCWRRTSARWSRSAPSSSS
jgi:hypothetical protein